MVKPLRVLVAEDNEADYNLLTLALSRGGFDVTALQVQDASAFAHALSEQAWDIVISDYAMPGFSAPDALALVQASGLDLPFIVVSGAIGEETAVAMMRAGAHDYLMKGNLARLAPAVERELAEAQMRRERRSAQEALRESEERYRQMFEHMSSGVAVCEVVRDGEDFVVQGFNSAAERIDGVSRSELLGRSVREVFPGVDEMGLLETLRRVWQTGEPEYQPPALYCDERHSGWRESFVYRLPTGQVVAIYDDVTEQVAARDALHETAERLRAVIEASPVAIIMLSPEGQVLLWNDAAERTFGWTEDEVLEAGSAVLPETNRELFRAVVGSVASEGRFADLELSVPRKDGSEVFASISAAPVCDPEGRFIAAMGVLVDITERTQAARLLRASEERFRLLYEEAPVPYQSLDEDGNITEVNRTWLTTLGYERAEVIGRCFSDFLAPEERPLFLSRYANFKSADVVSQMPWVMLHKNGSSVLAEFEGRVQRAVDGRFKQSHCTFQDVTARRQAEAALRRSEERFRSLFENSPIGMWEGDFSGVKRWLNELRQEGVSDLRAYVQDHPAAMDEAVSRISVLDANAFILSRLNLQSPPQLLDWIRAMVRTDARLSLVEFLLRLAEGERLFSLEAAIDLPDGQRQYVIVQAVVMPGHEQNLSRVTTFAIDITDRREAANALAAERERLAVTLRSIGEGVIAANITGGVVLMNRAAENLTGWSEAEALGRLIHEVVQPVDERTGMPLPCPVAEVLRGEPAAFPSSVVLLSRSGERHSVACSAAPLRDSEAETVGVVLVLRDTTEEQRLRAEALRVEKLESLSVLAGGIAHDFNNALLVVAGNLQMARLFPVGEQKHAELLNNAEQACLQARQLTEQLLTFAKGGAPVKEVASLSSFVRDTALFAASGSKVRCEFSSDDELWPVEVDLGQMSQMINNLVINAEQAMPTGGVLRVSLRNVILDEDSGMPLRAGPYVAIAVQDEGTGIPADQLGRIFDPYFTTKSSGSGLGLASCYSIIDQHGGHITVSSEVGVGSVFTVYLPRTDRPDAGHGSAAQVIPTGSGRILVMDDEQAVRELGETLLTELGYTVETVASGEEAVAAYRAAVDAGTPFAAVILDLTVRGAMGGKETIVALREIDPNVKAIVCSGYSVDPIMAQHREHGFGAVVVKPYDVAELAQAVASLTATGGPPDPAGSQQPHSTP